MGRGVYSGAFRNCCQAFFLAEMAQRFRRWAECTRGFAANRPASPRRAALERTAPLLLQEPSTLTPSYILLSGREASLLAKRVILELEARS